MPQAAFPDAADDRAPPTLRERLRIETRQDHEALDALFDGMLEDESDRRYRGFVAMNLLAHRAIEPRLVGALAEAGWQPGDRLEAAERDARALGLEAAEPPPFPLAPLAVPAAFGVAYVLEGSRLGARFMLKALKAREADAPRNRLPTHYLQASGDPSPFRNLLTAMNEAGMTEDDQTLAIEAARRTFRYFRQIAATWPHDGGPRT
ncbi:biliverdin-producing heme oxygenase [Aureimonas pseudogalii]|uniref:Heme oxygenase n=1 Tax=Aureimonas pseudogalii TaxID=1744844 RepID=A0A7W6E930_9HYPH|nr:biliverdin-producing heme oxygenase [Aureimonas pseudogalii]MBB3997011.1 heme oxygenase [Aureimonas pseudogalii]